MLIGASRCPWECEQKGLMLTYQKMLMLPMPDYSFRCNLWKELIISKGGQITKYSDRFDVSSLSKISEGMSLFLWTFFFKKMSLYLCIFFKGYTSGHISKAVDATLTERRLLQQRQRPLQPVEFIAFLAWAPIGTENP